MGIKVKKFSIRTGDVVYLPGDVITDFDEAEEQKLVDDGYCEFVGLTEAVTEKVITIDGPVTIEEFTVLKADEQKELLEKATIEAGSNAAARIQQYTDWLAEQEGKKESDDPDAGGPKTGL